MFKPDESLRITAANYHRATMDEWQAAFWNLYGAVDLQMPLYDMMLQLVGDSTRLAEAVRKRDYREAFPLLAQVFSWLSTMTSKVTLQNEMFADLGDGKSLSEIIWNKYPGICFFCFNAECFCPVMNVDDRSKVDREARKREQKVAIYMAQRSHNRPSTLDDWVTMFQGIYGGALRTRTVSEKTFHFLEEIGEVEVELRAADRILAGSIKPRTIEWEDEIADVFSWLTAVFLHIRGFMERANEFAEEYQRMRGVPGDDGKPVFRLPLFSEVLWNEFGDLSVGLRCHRCLKTRCDMTSVDDGEAVDNRSARLELATIPHRR